MRIAIYLPLQDTPLYYHTVHWYIIYRSQVIWVQDYISYKKICGGEGPGRGYKSICYWEGPIWAENTVQGTKNYFGNIGPRALYKLVVIESSILVIACGLWVKSVIGQFVLQWVLLVYDWMFMVWRNNLRLITLYKCLTCMDSSQTCSRLSNNPTVYSVARDISVLWSGASVSQNDHWYIVRLICNLAQRLIPQSG